MGPDLDVMLFAVADRFLHDQGVTGVEAAGDVGMVDEWKKLQITGADGVVSILNPCQKYLPS